MDSDNKEEKSAAEDNTQDTVIDPDRDNIDAGNREETAREGGTGTDGEVILNNVEENNNVTNSVKDDNAETEKIDTASAEQIKDGVEPGIGMKVEAGDDVEAEAGRAVDEQGQAEETGASVTDQRADGEVGPEEGAEQPGTGTAEVDVELSAGEGEEKVTARGESEALVDDKRGGKETDSNKTEENSDQQMVEDGSKPVADDVEQDSPSAEVGVMEEVTTVEGQTETVAMETETYEGPHHEVDPRSPSPKPATATVKFVLMPLAHVTTMACPLAHPMAQLKEMLSGLLRILPKYLLIMYNGSVVEDDRTLKDLGVDVNGAVQLEVSSSDPVNAPIKPPKPQPEYSMPDIITVTVENENGTPREFVVEIERSTRHKPFLGGYRHKLTGVEFHHASSQTRAKTRPDNGIARFCRDTQTVTQRHKAQQVAQNTSTQMTKIGCYVSNMPDKLMAPGKYTTASDYHERRLEAVIVLQSYFRKWQAKHLVVGLKEDLCKRAEWERQEEARKIREKDERIRKEFERRMNPRTKEDFDLLYHALEKWRKEELAVIDATMTGAKRKAALCHLLDQETQLIAAIGRHKREADTDNKQRTIHDFLSKAAAPRRWKGSDGKYMEMDTAYTVRARELRDIYNSLNMAYLTQDERLDALLTLKHTVKEHDCKLTQEIIELVDREADLLMRGTKESNLEGLRKRISTLFLQYIKTPTFNAEAARLLRVPQDPSTLRQNIYFCQSCSAYLPSTEFQLASNSKLVGKCRKCLKLDNDARIREDFSHYRFMLRALRRSEEAAKDGSRIALLLQEADLRYLVEDIWNSHSALSGWEDLYDLVLVRWDKDEEWAPWNCVLLTKDEATSHFQVENLEMHYGRVFCHKIRTKHTLAKNYFSRLPGMATAMKGKLPQAGVTQRLVPTKPAAAAIRT